MLYLYTDKRDQSADLLIRDPDETEMAEGFTVECVGCGLAATFVEYGGRRYLSDHNLTMGMVVDWSCNCYATGECD